MCTYNSLHDVVVFVFVVVVVAAAAAVARRRCARFHARILLGVGGSVCASKRKGQAPKKQEN